MENQERPTSHLNVLITDRWPLSEYVHDERADWSIEAMRTNLQLIYRDIHLRGLLRRRPNIPTGSTEVKTAHVTSDRPQTVLVNDAAKHRMDGLLDKAICTDSLPRKNLKRKGKTVHKIQQREPKDVKRINKRTNIVSASSNTKGGKCQGKVTKSTGKQVCVTLSTSSSSSSSSSSTSSSSSSSTSSTSSSSSSSKQQARLLPKPKTPSSSGVGLSSSPSKVYTLCKRVVRLKRGEVMKLVGNTFIIETDEPRIEKIEPRIEKIEPKIEKIEPRIEKIEPKKQKDEPGKQKDEPRKQKDEPGKQKDEPGKQKDEARKQKDEPGKQEDEARKQKDEARKQKDEPGKQKDEPRKQKIEPRIEKDKPRIEKDEPSMEEADMANTKSSTDTPDFSTQTYVTACCNSSSSSSSTEMLEPIGMKCMKDIIYLLSHRFGGTQMDNFEVLRRNNFNILRTIQELQYLQLNKTCAQERK